MTCCTVEAVSNDPIGLPRSIVVIACDGSGSMHEREICVFKLLASVLAEVLDGVPGVLLVAGAYSDASDQPGHAAGPEVYWLMHPTLAPVRTPGEAGRAIAAFPDAGAGRNHDTVSLSYMVCEASRLARGGTCFLVNLTDTRFNSDDPTRTGKELMEEFLHEARAVDGVDLNYSVVAIGVEEDYRLAGADAVLVVPVEGLNDTVAIVERIARHITEALA